MTLEHRDIPIDGRTIEAIAFGLTGRSLVVIRGGRGYVMCGYLNLAAAEKFGDAAIMVTGVATIDDALKARVASCTSRARDLGVSEGQPIQDVLKLIA